MARDGVRGSTARRGVRRIGFAVPEEPNHEKRATIPTTTTLLLDSLKNEQDSVAWEEFDARYRRVIEDFARSLGLKDDDAAEVAQQTLADFVQAYRNGRYERGRGRLHSWIIGIAQNKVVDVFRARARGGGHASETSMGDLSDTERLTQVWDQQLRQTILRRALERLKTETNFDDRTLQAFEMVALRGVAVEAAAEQCGMKPADVYVAKHRALAKLRQIVAELTEAYTSGI